MTREEAKEWLDTIIARYEVEDEWVTLCDRRHYIAIKMAIKALEQEPCKDVISIPKDALKWRGKNMVAYNVEWLREYWQKEMDIVCGIKPCEDAISRQAVDEAIYDYSRSCDVNYAQIMERIDALPGVTPKQRTGHWIEENINEWSRKVFCSECGCPPSFEYVSNGDVYSASGYGVINKTRFCPNCGAKMIEPKESEGRK